MFNAEDSEFTTGFFRAFMGNNELHPREAVSAIREAELINARSVSQRAETFSEQVSAVKYRVNLEVDHILLRAEVAMLELGTRFRGE